MKLVYFDSKGLAETSRIILEINKHDYEDVRYPIEYNNDKNLFLKKEFEEDLNKGIFVKSMNKLPFLEFEGHVICQSKAIERFLSKKFGLMGSNDIEEAHIDSICECIRDFKDQFKKIEKDPDLLKKYFEIDLPLNLNRLALMMNENGSSYNYSVGNKLSLADISLFSFINDFFTEISSLASLTSDKNSAILSCKRVPKIRLILKNVGELEQVKDWLSIRPITNF